MFRFSVTTMALLGVLALSATVWAADSGGRKSLAEEAKGRMANEDYRDILGRPGNGPNVGEMAPDFNLMPLKFYEFGIDEQEITKENAGDLYKPVRLSDFRGHKPVVLIFGSYT